ncbi:hypothetical protein ACFLR4_03610, partial [Bacteroidota bacterium]
MNEFSLKNILSRISYLKLAGVKKFVLLEAARDYVKIAFVQIKMPFYDISSGISQNNIRIIARTAEKFSGDLNDLDYILKKFIEENEAEEAYLIIGVNDYRLKKVMVSKEEELDLWFDENRSKFIPPGKMSEDFRLSYEKYKEDEDHYYCLAAVSRADYLEKLTKVCSQSGLKILSITPFLTSLHKYEPLKNKNGLYLEISNRMVKYIFSDFNQNLFTGEIYHEIFNHENETDVESRSYEIEQCVNKLYEALTATSNIKNLDELEVFISVDPEYYSQFEKAVSSAFQVKQTNNGIENLDPDLTGIYFTLNNELSFHDTKINLLDEETIGTERMELDKNIGLRTTISSGVVLIFFLFTGENFVVSKISEGEESLSEVTAKASVVRKLEEENNKLNSNLSSLIDLRDGNISYSKLLKGVSDIITRKSLLTDLVLEEVSAD